MKFGKFLEESTVPEWGDKYIAYGMLKKKIYSLKDDVTANRTTREHCDVVFSVTVTSELDKVSGFYAEQLQHMRDRISAVEETAVESSTDDAPRPASLDAALRLACLEYYRGLQMLKNFSIVNNNGFAKILKKYDKSLESHLSSSLKTRVDCAAFNDTVVIDRMLDELKELFAVEFTGGDTKKAADLLFVAPNSLDPVLNSAKNTHPIFHVGLLTGLAIALVGVLIAEMTMDTAWSANRPWIVIWLNVYRVLAFLVGISLALAGAFLVFAMLRINYVFIFDLNPRDHLSVPRFAELSLLFAVSVILSFVLYIKSLAYEEKHGNSVFIPSFVQPFILLVALFVFAVFPVPGRLYFSSRRWLWRALARIAASPFLAVHFPEFWVADQLSSLAYYMGDLNYVTCSSVGDLIDDHPFLLCSGYHTLVVYVLCSLPSYFRLMQCFRRYKDTKRVQPYLTGSVKFLISIAILALAAFQAVHDEKQGGWSASHVITFILLFSSSAFRTYWDTVHDFGLFPKSDLSGRKFHHIKGFYVFAVIFNGICRFFWVFSFAANYRIISPWSWLFVMGIIEIFRKSLWNVVHVENEHVNNAGNFRAVKEIPLPVKLTSSSSFKSTIQFSSSMPTFLSLALPPTTQQRILSRRASRSLLNDDHNRSAYEGTGHVDSVMFSDAAMVSQDADLQDLETGTHAESSLIARQYHEERWT